MKDYSEEQCSGCGFLSVFSNIGNKLGDLIKTVTAIGFMNRLFSNARFMCFCYIYNRNKIRGAVKPLLFNSFAKYVSADSCNNRSGTHPSITCFCRVIIVYSAARRVPAVNCISCGFFCGFIRLNAPVAVPHAGECAALIDNSRNSVGKRRMAHTV